MAIKITGESVKSLKAHPDYKLVKADSKTSDMVEELLRGVWDSIDDR